jgi:hypothetical protein
MKKYRKTINIMAMITFPIWVIPFIFFVGTFFLLLTLYELIDDFLWGNRC